MIPYYDYHMHTPLCGHATGSPEEYVQQAIKIGLKEIGFSDHAPMVNKPMPHITMAMDELPKYHAMIEDVQKRFASQINIKRIFFPDMKPKPNRSLKATLMTM
jgi:histidinol-phosphatase (PHP family)